MVGCLKKRLSLVVMVLFISLLVCSSAFAAIVANNDTLVVEISSFRHLNVTVNDVGSNLKVGQVGSALHGTTSLNNNGTIRYVPTPGYTGIDKFNYTVTNNSLYSNVTGHYYEYISAGGAITWSAANASANSRTLFGLQGYLATMTSAAEQSFITTKLAGQGWFGASDAHTEGIWRWVTGPERGTQFWSGLGSDSEGSAVGGRYSNWNGGGEPNNAGDEDYGQFLYPGGAWNDLPNNAGGITAYVVEYGGLEGDEQSFPTGWVTVYVRDRTSPTISFVSPTPSASSYTNESLVSVNITVSDVSNRTYAFINEALSGWYRFDNQSSAGENATSVRDWSSYGRNATVLGGASRNATGKFNGSLVFDGVDDFVSAGQDGFANHGENYTVSAWVRFDVVNGNYRTIVARWNVGNLQEFTLQLNADDHMGWFVGDGAGSGSAVVSTAPFLADRWYHVAGVREKNSIRLYVDGALNSTGTASFSSGVSITNLTIGSKKNNGDAYFEFMDGQIDDILLFNRTLDAREIRGLYNMTSQHLLRNFTSYDGTANVSVYAFDGGGNIAFSSRSFTVDTQNPRVFSPLPLTDTRYSRLSVINLSVNASDNQLVRNVTAWIQFPNGTVLLRNMTNSSGAMYAANFTMPYVNGNYTVNFTIVDRVFRRNATSITLSMLYSDIDNDDIPDPIDTLIGNSTFVQTGGQSFNITISGNSTNGTFSGSKVVVFYNGSSPIINFTQNFTSGGINLSKVTINLTSDGIAVNFSGQLTGRKTLVMADRGFNRFCVKDAPVASISHLTSDCTGVNETDFRSCLGNSTGVTIDGITCVDSGDTISVGNLTHSALKGSIVTADSSPSSGGGGSGSGGGGSYGVAGKPSIYNMTFVNGDAFKQRLRKGDGLRYVPDGRVFSLSRVNVSSGALFTSDLGSFLISTSHFYRQRTQSGDWLVFRLTNSSYSYAYVSVELHSSSPAMQAGTSDVTAEYENGHQGNDTSVVSGFSATDALDGETSAVAGQETMRGKNFPWLAVGLLAAVLMLLLVLILLLLKRRKKRLPEAERAERFTYHGQGYSASAGPSRPLTRKDHDAIMKSIDASVIGREREEGDMMKDVDQDAPEANPDHAPLNTYNRERKS